MFKELMKSGRLNQALMEAQKNTSEALADLIAKGTDYHQALEMVLPEWILLPSEEDVPTLGERFPQNLLL